MWTEAGALSENMRAPNEGTGAAVEVSLVHSSAICILASADPPLIQRCSERHPFQPQLVAATLHDAKVHEPLVGDRLFIALLPAEDTCHNAPDEW